MKRLRLILVVTAVWVAGSTGRVQNCSAGIVNWWALDDGSGSTATDTVGGDDASLSGPAWVTTGLISSATEGNQNRDFGTGLQFNDNNDQFIINGYAGLPTTLGTISMWVKPEPLTNGQRMVFYYQSNQGVTDLDRYNGFGYNTTADPIMEIHTGLRSILVNGEYKAQFYTTYQDGVSDIGGDNGIGRGTLGSQLLNMNDIDGNTWYHLAVSWGRTTTHPQLRLFLDGVENATNWGDYPSGGKDWADLTPTLAQFGQPGDPATTNRYFSGVVDDLAVWDFQIGASSAMKLYQGYSPDDASNIVSNPEPGSMMLAALGGGFILRRTRRRRADARPVVAA